MLLFILFILMILLDLVLWKFLGKLFLGIICSLMLLDGLVLMLVLALCLIF